MSGLDRAAVEPEVTRREILRVWAYCVGGIGLAKLISLVDPTGLLGRNLAGVAAVLFIALPDRRLRARAETWEAYGLPWWGIRDARTWRAWGRGLAVGLLVCAVVFPPFVALSYGFARIVPSLPAWAMGQVSPHTGQVALHLRLPADLGPLEVVNQFLVIALPEELFYRGWMQTLSAASAPARKKQVLGATIGAGFVVTQVLFAAGHLASIPALWRLGTFFPGLLFGWVRARTGNVAAGVVVHALSNLFIAVLEASLY